MRTLVAILMGTVVTLGLFLTMSRLAMTGGSFSGSRDQAGMMDFIRIKDLMVPKEREREIPKKPEPKKKPPVPNQVNLADAQKPSKPNLKMNAPNFKVPFNMKGGPFLGQAGGGGMDGQLMPIVRIEPRYPRKAAMDGKEGWVTLKFDITQMGTVANVKVLESHPRRTFDASARRALLKWKYKPGTENGRPVAQLNNKVKIDFKLR